MDCGEKRKKMSLGWDRCVKMNLKRQKLVRVNHTHALCVCREVERGEYPKLPLHDECTLETSEKVKSGIGSMGWKELWCKWEEWWATLPPTALGKQEEEEEDRERGLGLMLQMTEGWDTAEDRGGKGRHSSCPMEWLRDCLKVALDLDWRGVASPWRQLSTNLWEPMASCGSMWRCRRDIILGAVDTKQQHYQQPHDTDRA